MTTLPERLLIAAEILEGIGGQSAMAATVREAAAALQAAPEGGEVLDDSAKVAELKVALARAVEIAKEQLAAKQAVMRDRDDKDIRHFNEMRELRRDRDNLRERVSILTTAPHEDGHEKDAERYRWLRKFSTNGCENKPLIPVLVWSGPYQTGWIADIDGQIDHVMARMPKHGTAAPSPSAALQAGEV